MSFLPRISSCLVEIKSLCVSILSEPSVTFHLGHCSHFRTLVWFCAEQVYPGRVFRRYALLGDDIGIGDRKVAEVYNTKTL